MTTYSTHFRSSYPYSGPSVSASQQAWPSRPPYQGPPPLPPGVNVNQQQWQAGFWQFNPAFNPNAAQSRGQPNQYAHWIPGQAWQQYQQQQQQQSAQHNPYKRVPREPSAEYMATKLSDNPLGLTNMIPAEDLYGKEEEPAPAHTPWTWNPLNLPNSSGSEEDNRHAQTGNSSSSDPAAPHGHMSTAIYGRPRTASHAQMRHSSEPPLSHPNQHQNGHDSRTRQGSEPIPTPSSTASHINKDTLPPLDRPLDRPREYQRRYSDASLIYAQPRTPERSAALQQQQQVRQEENFTAKRELQPTFSVNIVRTPKHYQTPSPSRNASRNSHSSLDGCMERLSISTNHTPSRQNSSIHNSSALHPSLSESHSSLYIASGSSSVSGVSALSDEPTSILSPLIIASTPKPANQPISRNATVPVINPNNPLSSIPESLPHPVRHASYPDVSPIAMSRSHSTSRPSSRHSSRPSSRPASLNASPQQHGNISTERHITPPTQRLPNPLPAPPSEVRMPVTMPIPSPIRAEAPPANFRERVRKGFWNRRGDHLTLAGYIVYAPPEKAYPHDLRGYPSEAEGYRDHLGTFTEYVQRPELPESLPRHGQPPVQPYESFITYEYRM